MCNIVLRRSPLLCLALLGAALGASPVLAAVQNEPTPESAWRTLRNDHVKTWHIFNDSQTDGILNPGDTRIDTFKNWWTPVSASTQHNYDEGPYGANRADYLRAQGYDAPSGPMNFASQTAASQNYWLPREKNTMAFYLTYSQYDNNDFDTYMKYTDPNDKANMYRMRNRQRNGWAMGWLVNEITLDNQGNAVLPANPSGQTQYPVDMDIFIHDGRGDINLPEWAGQTSRSKPQVTLSNDISHLAYELDSKQFIPPHWDETTQSYNPNHPANVLYKQYLNLTDAQFNQIVQSMAVYERYAMGVAPSEAIDPNRTPAKIAASLFEHDGLTPYLYQDAFQYRESYVDYSNDGGVIAGLFGQESYDPILNNWADQQVIRIDLSDRTFTAGDIDKLVFYDFGDSVPSSVDGGDPNQLNPRKIEFFIDPTQTVAHGQIYFDDGSGNRVWFPENRIYIAQVHIPEPMTIALLGIGGSALAFRRRRRG